MRKWAAFLALALGGAFGTSASADVIMGFDQIFSGSTPTTSPPWVGVTFADDGANQVKLTINDVDLPSAAKIDGFYFNFANSSLNVTGLSFSLVSGVSPSTPLSSSIHLGSDAFKADGTGGDFDIKIDYPNSGATFGSGSISVLEIVGTGITAADFNHVSAPDPANHPDNSYLAAAHFQAIDSQGNSGWAAADLTDIHHITPVPLPSVLSLGLVLLGVVGVGRAWRRYVVA